MDLISKNNSSSNINIREIEVSLYNSEVRAYISNENSIDLLKRGYRLLPDYKCYRPPYIKIIDLSNLVEDYWLDLNPHVFCKKKVHICARFFAEFCHPIKIIT